MATTTAKTIPYPVAGDATNIHTDFANLCNWIDAWAGGYTTAALAALAAGAKWTGRRNYNSDLGCFQWWNGSAFVNEQALVINAQTGTAYTLVLADANGKLITLTNAGAITLTIPTNASVAFAIGTVILCSQDGVGQVTVAGAGITFQATPGQKSRTQYSGFSLIKKATDTWQILGDLSA